MLLDESRSVYVSDQVDLRSLNDPHGLTSAKTAATGKNRSNWICTATAVVAFIANMSDCGVHNATPANCT
jgi:hypothetical protein